MVHGLRDRDVAGGRDGLIALELCGDDRRVCRNAMDNASGIHGSLGRVRGGVGHILVASGAGRGCDGEGSTVGPNSDVEGASTDGDRARTVDENLDALHVLNALLVKHVLNMVEDGMIVSEALHTVEAGAFLVHVVVFEGAQIGHARAADGSRCSVLVAFQKHAASCSVPVDAVEHIVCPFRDNRPTHRNDGWAYYYHDFKSIPTYIRKR